jgi:hypothetical protein
VTTKTALCCSVLLAVLLGGCQQHGDEIRIGEFGSLTGGTATFGTSSHEGVMLALDEINNDGGLLGKKVRVLTEDNQSKPEESVTAVLKLIKQDEVSAVIGEVASSRTLAAAPTCQANHVPLLSPASTNPKVTQVGDYVFRACFIDPFQGSTMAKFAVERLKAKRIAILTDMKNDYSVGLAQFFRETAKKLGAEIVAEESYAEGDIEFDFRLQLQTDSHLMPIENNAVLWPEALSPRVSVATLRLPRQKFDSPAQLEFAKRLSYNPWHTIAEHRPLGNQSRARRRMYETLSKLRHSENAVPHYEPTGDEVFE